MNKESSQSILFGAEVSPPRSWRSYATSFAVHILLLAVLLLIPVAVTRQIQEHRVAITLVAPPLKPYQPKIKPPHIQAPKLVAKNEIKPLPTPVLPPPPKPQVKPPVTPPVQRAIPEPIQPQIAAAEPKPVPHLDTAEPAPAPRPRPAIHTGVFAAEDAAKKAAVAKQLAIGGFGDPNGAHANPNAKAPTLLAKVGSFEILKAPVKVVAPVGMGEPWFARALSARWKAQEVGRAAMDAASVTGRYRARVSAVLKAATETALAVTAAAAQ